MLDLLTADYTFLNERLALHYGIETVKGDQLPPRARSTDPARYGLLGKGAILMVTAYPNRTSPVLRGAWILERLLGHAAGAAAAQRASVAGEQGTASSRKTLRAAAGAASRESDLHRLSRRDGSARASRSRTSTRSGSTAPLDRDTRDADRRGRRAAGRHGGAAARTTCARRCSRGPTQFVQTLTEKLMTYALGRSLEYRDMPSVRAHRARRPAADDYRFSSIVMGIVTSDAVPQDAGRATDGQLRTRTLKLDWFRRSQPCSSPESICRGAPSSRARARPSRCRCSTR